MCKQKKTLNRGLNSLNGLRRISEGGVRKDWDADGVSVYECMCVCARMFVDASVCKGVYECVYCCDVYFYMCACVHASECVHVCAQECVRVFVCMCVRTYVRLCVRDKFK